MAYAIGIDVGGTRVKTVAVTPGGKPLDQAMFRTGDADHADWADQVRGQVEELESRQNEAASWIGVAAPGLAAPDGSCITWMQGRMAVLEGLVWRDVLDRRHPVPVINDGQAALMAEVWRGAARGCDNVVMLTLGTGVGGAILCDGRLLKGAIGRAGHLGHISLDAEGDPDIVNTPGSLEWMIGNASIQERSAGRFESTRELLDAMSEGDDVARRIWRKSVRALSAGIASIINAVDPELIVLAGGIVQAGDALFEPLAQALDAFEWRPFGHRVRIEAATGGEFAGAIGAAYHALCESDAEPTGD